MPPLSSAYGQTLGGVAARCRHSRARVATSRGVLLETRWGVLPLRQRPDAAVRPARGYGDAGRARAGVASRDPLSALVAPLGRAEARAGAPQPARVRAGSAAVPGKSAAVPGKSAAVPGKSAAKIRRRPQENPPENCAAVAGKFRAAVPRKKSAAVSEPHSGERMRAQARPW